MDLSAFIEQEIPAIVVEWAQQALRLAGEGRPLSAIDLEKAGAQLLASVAADMRTLQEGAGQAAKSRGEFAEAPSAVKDAAQRHADDRLSQGFSLDDIIAEYRALRATVLRLWQESNSGGAAAFQQMIRFNEAIDEALTESAREHQKRTERERTLLAGILAHDLRSPLSAITNSVELIDRVPGTPPIVMKAADNARRSASRMKRMIDDLLDFTRARLGEALPMTVSSQDLAQLCRHALDEVRASYPDAAIELTISGDVNGVWDGARLSQILVNLLVNAVQHGRGGAHLRAIGEDETVRIEVSNVGDRGRPYPGSRDARAFRSADANLFRS